MAQNRQPIIIDNLRNEKDYIADTQPARSEICVPMTSGERVLGVIDSESPEFSAFGEAELEILSTVAAMTSAKIELLEETRTSQKRYEDLMAAHAELTRETNNRKTLEAELFEARQLEAIGRLTGKFAHEFNGLLTVISGNVELLELSNSPEETKELQDSVKKSTARGARLIKDMLAFAQRAHLVPERLDINALVSSVCKDLDPPARDRVELELANDPWPVSVDPVATQNILLRLVLNGFEANAEGGDCLHHNGKRVSYAL